MTATNDKESALICPISGERMTDPVMDPEGNTYDRASIMEWLRTHPPGSSPITRTPLSQGDLVPNRVLRDLLESDGNKDKKPDISSENKSMAPKAPVMDVTLQTSYDGDTGLGLVQIKTSDEPSTRHAPKSIVAVIDISASMDCLATIKDDVESDGMSVLDIVKHATRAVIKILGSHDKLAIVVYSDHAEVIQNFIEMTPENKVKACNTIDTLRTKGSTNLWDGLLKAMELCTTEESSSVLLLTDGMPNISPPRGEVRAMNRYLENHPKLACQINTFGFGYSVNSTLLCEIASKGGGHYGFIPDASFVGTCFVNAVANILSTAALNIKLSLEDNDGIKISKCLSGQENISTSWGMRVIIPALQYGRCIDILVKLDGNPTDDIVLTATLDLKDVDPDLKIVTKVLETNMKSSIDTNLSGMKVAKLRSDLINLIQRYTDGNHCTADELNLAHLEVINLLKLHGENDGLDIASVNAIRQDLSGQIKEAYSKVDWYNRWGRHYLLSLCRAHVLQQCSNFKDPGVQIYSSKKFSSIRDEAEDIFINLSPPKPSAVRQKVSRGKFLRSPSRHCATLASVPSTLSTSSSFSARYMNKSAPCFASGLISLSNGMKKDIAEIQAGDRVKTSAEEYGLVRCVVKTAISGGVCDMVNLGKNVLVTQWHPVRERGTQEWRFPVDLNPSKETNCNFVYSLVLEKRCSCFMIGNFEAVSLGHGLVDGIARHSYLGTSKVIDDLSQMEGWKDGLINLDPNPAIRDLKSGLMVKLVQYNDVKIRMEKPPTSVQELKTSHPALARA